MTWKNSVFFSGENIIILVGGKKKSYIDFYPTRALNVESADRNSHVKFGSQSQTVRKFIPRRISFESHENM